MSTHAVKQKPKKNPPLYSCHWDIVEPQLLQEYKSKVDLEGWWVVRITFEHPLNPWNLCVTRSQAKNPLIFVCLCIEVLPLRGLGFSLY